MFTTIVLLGIVGFLPALALTRRLLFAIPLSTAVTVIVSGAGATVATAMGVSVVASILLIAALCDAMSIWSLWHTRKSAASLWMDRDVVAADGIAVLMFGIPAVALMALFPLLPLGADPITIWWFHASWFYAGGDTVRQLIANPLVAFSHVSYPPGVSAAQATAWRIHGGKDLALAQTLTSVFSGLAVAGLTLTLWFRSRTLAMAIAGLAVIAAGCGLDKGLGAAGYMDLLVAALLVTSGCAFLGIADRRLCIAVACTCLGAASMTKGEGLIFGTVVVAIAAIWRRRDAIRIVGWSVVAILPALAWQALVYSINTHPYSDVSAPDVLHLFGSRDRARLPFAASSVFGAVWPLFVTAFAVLVLVGIAVAKAKWKGISQQREAVRALVGACGLLVIAFLIAIADAVVYATGQWAVLLDWLNASLSRTTLSPRLFAIASMVTVIPICMNLAYARWPVDSCGDGQVGTKDCTAVSVDATGSRVEPERM